MNSENDTDRDLRAAGRLRSVIVDLESLFYGVVDAVSAQFVDDSGGSARDPLASR